MLLLRKILRFSCFYFLLSISFVSYAFDVRVLLQQFSNKNLVSKSVVIHSETGFFVNGKKNTKRSLALSRDKTNFKVDGKVIRGDVVEISPLFTEKHHRNIKNIVAHWLKKHQGNHRKQFLSLHDFFRKFVTEKGMRNFSKVYETVETCVDDFLSDLLQDVENPVISLQSLQSKARNFIKLKLKTYFTDAIVQQKISKKYKKLLKKNEQKRNEFFVQILEKTIKRLLVHFVSQMPHKIMKQVLDEETGVLKFNGNSYLGSFAFMQQGKQILLINSVDIDDYLLSVVRSEGWPGWPLEVNKVFAITSRTYLVSKILEAHRLKRPYHIVNTIKHQTYNGHHKYYAKLKRAVDETRDVFISYEGKPIVAMFDACCGGVIPAKVSTINFDKFPYLARKKQCNYCKKCWIYSWKKEFSKSKLVDLFKTVIPKISKIKDIKIVDKDAAGLIQRVMISAPEGKFYISGKKMYSLFPEIKSFYYNIKRKGAYIQILGKGYGHHVGLCQWGAWKMVQDHWNYEKILKFYYPGTELMKLSYQR